MVYRRESVVGESLVYRKESGLQERVWCIEESLERVGESLVYRRESGVQERDRFIG